MNTQQKEMKGKDKTPHHQKDDKNKNMSIKITDDVKSDDHKREVIKYGDKKTESSNNK